MGKIALALKKIISSFGRTICVLPEEQFVLYRKNLFSENFPEEPSSGSFPEEPSSGRTICILPEEPSSGKLPEEGSFGRTICSSGRRFFRMNNLFYRKNLLPEKLPEEGSSGRTNCSSGRIFFQRSYRKNFFR
ncbi:hypothetical protein HKD37_19G055155 [Glycine soja]